MTHIFASRHGPGIEPVKTLCKRNIFEYRVTSETEEPNLDEVTCDECVYVYKSANHASRKKP